MLIYNPQKTYEENYNRNLEEFANVKFSLDKEPILKLSAGPALNSKYVELFARLGYDVITYKSVSSKARKVHPFPNILVKTNGAWRNPKEFDWQNIGKIEAITNYFGLPSVEPKIWQEDVKLASKYPKEFVVGVVGESLEEFVKVIDLAVEAAPNAIIELDLSCPNFGQLFYKNKQFMRDLHSKLENYSQKFIAKIGVFESKEAARTFTEYGRFYAIETVNAIQQDVLGKRKGVCGPEIHEIGLRNVRWLAELKDGYKIIGTGGVKDRKTAMNYIEAGADIVGIATMALFDPDLPRKIKTN